MKHKGTTPSAAYSQKHTTESNTLPVLSPTVNCSRSNTPVFCFFVSLSSYALKSTQHRRGECIRALEAARRCCFSLFPFALCVGVPAHHTMSSHHTPLSAPKKCELQSESTRDASKNTGRHSMPEQNRHLKSSRLAPFKPSLMGANPPCFQLCPGSLLHCQTSFLLKKTNCVEAAAGLRCMF